MPLFRRVPKHGFNNPFRTESSIVNVGRLQSLVDEGRLDSSEPVTPEQLEAEGVIRDASRVKVLGDGNIEADIEISAHAFSGSAKEKIEEAGGSTSSLETDQ